MPIPASMILRLMLEKGNVPQKNVLWSIILHMICDHFLLLSASKSNHAKLIKPDTMIFNIVLDGCVRFGSSFKGQQIIELMPQEGLKIQIVPELLQKDSVFKMDSKQELVLFSNGKYVISNKALVKLIIAYEGGGRIGELSRLMVSLQKELGTLEGGGLISDVIDACIQLGWLETAHDILDDMELAGAPIGSSTYMSLLTAYYKGKMAREAKALLKQMRKAGFVVDLSDEMVMTTCLLGVVDKNRMHTRTSTSIWELRFG
ncbi:hypothetical protein AAG906_034241 [Vitis piasezkii]